MKRHNIGGQPLCPCFWQRLQENGHLLPREVRLAELTCCTVELFSSRSCLWAAGRRLLLLHLRSDLQGGQHAMSEISKWAQAFFHIGLSTRKRTNRWWQVSMCFQTPREGKQFFQNEGIDGITCYFPQVSVPVQLVGTSKCLSALQWGSELSLALPMVLGILPRNRPPCMWGQKKAERAGMGWSKHINRSYFWKLCSWFISCG